MLRLIHSLKQLARNTRKRTHAGSPRRQPEFTRFTYLLGDAYFADTEELPLMDNGTLAEKQLIGRTSADEIVPYSPGIPVLVPGQEISVQIVRYLQQLLQGQKTHRDPRPDLPLGRAAAAGGQGGGQEEAG
ncbi:Orn/Lys/Arg family decarboxylase [Microbulbifer celer]|uniref:Orn/Lys/Arg decarboxylase C-terminal domain-containing protein n=1 Tax=Microbulbifer celer TaxID=435905 RepID=A0ABW3UD04_9GAMM|nr:hypothetical protein [Microbulbifer celer]UFN55955.1 hypothetical protein LPW13_10225 [Microbulbifer celer]